MSWFSRGRVPLQSEVLGQALEVARECVPLQGAPELYEVFSVGEVEDEQRLARWTRAQGRRQRKRSVRAEVSVQARREREAARRVVRAERERRWLESARVARERVTNPDALVGALHHRARRSSLVLRGVMGVGLVWSAVNVGRNLAPAAEHAGVTWWLLWLLSFGIEAMISVPILEIMAQAATAARLGQRVDRARIVVFEATLLTGTVGLNTGPHLLAGHFARAVEYAVAPVMVAVLMWLHAWLANRYADLIDALDARSTTAARATSGNDIADPVEFNDFVVRAGESAAIGAEAAEVAYPLPGLTRDIGSNYGNTDDSGAVVEWVARELRRTRRSGKPLEEIVAILRMAVEGTNPNAIATEMTARTNSPWPRSTVDRIITRASELGLSSSGTRLEVVTTDPATA